MQSLSIGNNQWVKIDRTFSDYGLPAKMGVSGGHVVEMAPPVPARPTVWMANGGFYYNNCEPVTAIEHVGHLPPEHRKQAEQWIKAQAGKAPPLEVFTGKVTEERAPAPTDVGPPARRSKRVIASEEQAERELVGGPGGIREVEAEESRGRRQL